MIKHITKKKENGQKVAKTIKTYIQNNPMCSQNNLYYG